MPHAKVDALDSAESKVFGSDSVDQVLAGDLRAIHHVNKNKIVRQNARDVPRATIQAGNGLIGARNVPVTEGGKANLQVSRDISMS